MANNLKNEFNIFKKNYEKKLKDKLILNDNEYYLIDNSWLKTLSGIFLGNKSKKDQKEILSKNLPIFFFNIEKIIEFLSIKKNKLALISKSFINLIYEEHKFKKDNIVNIYLGYNSLIIEFPEEKVNDILLISNPLETIRNENEFILKIKNEPIQKIEFFKELLSDKNNLIDNNFKKIRNNNIIISFSKLKDIEKNKCEKQENNDKQEIAKIFIYIYYYENTLKIEPNKILMNLKQCYLINSDWIEKLKNYYDYQSLQNLLNGNTNKEINYNNLNNHLDELLSFLKNNFIEKMKLPEESIHSDLYNQLESKDDIYIIPKEIIDSMMKYFFKNKNILNEPISILLNDNNNIIISDSSKVNFGNLNDKLLFNSKYIFSYNNQNILDEEKKIIYSKSIAEYMDLRGCDSNSPNHIQDLKRNSEIIGKLTILHSKNLEDNKEKETSFNNQENSTQNQELNIKCKNIDNNIIDDGEFNQTNKEEKTDNKNQEIKIIKKKIFLTNESLNNQKKLEDKIENQNLIEESKVNENNNNASGEKNVNLEENKIEESDCVLQEIDIHGKKELESTDTKEINSLKKLAISEQITFEIKNNDNHREELKLKNENIKKEEELELEIKKIEEKSKKCIEDKDKEIETLNNNFVKTQEELVMAQNKLKQYENEINELKEIIKGKEKNEENYKNQIEDLKKAIIDLEKQDKELTNKKDEINNKISELSEKEKLIEKENNDLRKEKEEFEVDKNENIRIKKENEELNSKKEELRKEIDEKQLELNRLLSNIEEVNKNIRIPQNPLFQSISNISRRNISRRNSRKNSRRNSRFPQNPLIESIDNNIEMNTLSKNPLFQSIDNDMLIKYLDKNKEMKNKNDLIYKKPFIEGKKEEEKKEEEKEKEEEEKEEEEKEEEEEEEKEEEKKPILIGLNNIGATCFMNSTLQCLSQTKSLTDYFLNKKNADRIINNNICIKNKNELQLSPAYCDLIKKLWDKNGPKSFSPNNFMNIIEKMNPLFKKGQAGDSKDFIIFILEQLHKELKRPISENNSINIELNQYDRVNAFNYFFNDFKNECSIISDTFFGFNETTNECLNCKRIYNMNGLCNPICYNYGLFNCLIFPLEEVKNMKNMAIQNSLNNVVTLYDCFLYQQKSEIFTGENRNYCNICKQLFDSVYISNLYIGPNNLIIILNRGKGNIFNVKLEFSEIIDISQFIIQKDKPQIIYNLYGVITHIGQSGPNAHFIASCKNSIDNKWYRFNDAFVNPISDIKKEIIEFGTPYILFYQKN